MQLSRPCRRAAPATAVLAVILAAAPTLQAQQPDGYGAFLDSVEVKVVNVDVVVTDPSGAFVPGLERQDFELLLDGKPIEISHFAAYLPQPPPIAEAPAVAPAEEPGAPEAVVAPPPAAYAIFFDPSLLRPGERREIADQLQRFLDTGLRPGDRVLVATYNQGVRLLTDLTEDRSALAAALASLARSASGPGDVVARQGAILRDISFVDPADRNASVDAERIFGDIQMLEQAAVEEARSGVDAVAYVSDALAAIEGRKALLYAGGGFADSPVAHLYSVWEQKLGALAPGLVPPRTGGAQKGDFDRRQRAMIEKAGAHRVTFYAIGAGPDQGPQIDGADVGMSTGGGGDPGRLGALRYVASATGGMMLKASPQLGTALAKVADDYARYYSLAFTPAMDVDYHRLEVRVRRPGLLVRHRGGFRQESPGAQDSETAIAALLFNATANPLGAAIATGNSRREGRGDELLLPVTVKVPLQHLTLLPQGDHHQGKLSMDFAAREASGQVLVMERRDFDFNVPNEQLAAALGQYVTFAVDLKLRPGPYRVGVVVHDELGRVASSVTLEAQVTEAR